MAALITPETPVTFGTTEVAHMLGSTTRRIDWLERRGLIVATRPARGSGTRRGWSPRLVLEIRAVFRIVEAIAPDPSSRPELAPYVQAVGSLSDRDLTSDRARIPLPGGAIIEIDLSVTSEEADRGLVDALFEMG